VVKHCPRIADLLGGLQVSQPTQNVDLAALLQEVINQQMSAFTGKGLEFNAEAISAGLSGQNTDKGGCGRCSSPATPAAALTAPDGSREFISNVLMNESLWERLLPVGQQLYYQLNFNIHA
jgi:hypothetical protein